MSATTTVAYARRLLRSYVSPGLPETSISRRLFKIEVFFFLFVKIPLINDHLFYENFVLWSVGQATKGINVRIWRNVTPN